MFELQGFTGLIGLITAVQQGWMQKPKAHIGRFGVKHLIVV